MYPDRKGAPMGNNTKMCSTIPGGADSDVDPNLPYQNQIDDTDVNHDNPGGGTGC